MSDRHSNYAKRTAQSAQNVSESDLISRKAAIDAVYIQSDDDGWWTGTVQDMEELLAELPSVQPEETIEEQERGIDEALRVARDIATILENEQDMRVIRQNVQPQRMRGEWIYGEDEYGIDGYHCNKCGFFVPWDYTHTFINYIKDYNFCPNCGADMRDGDVD